MANEIQTDPQNAATSDMEIRDTDMSTIDVTQIMQQIRDRIRARTEAAEAMGQRYDLPEGLSSFDRSHSNHAGQMSVSLERLRGAANGVYIQLSVVEKSVIPILSPLLSRIRTAAHQLVLYYVGAFASRQTAFNRANVDAFQRMTYELELANRRIEQLEQNIKILNAQLPTGLAVPSSPE